VALADIDLPLMGGDYERATAAALQHVGSGTVTETTIEGFGASREVENFSVLGTEADDDGPDDVDEGGDN
jgi:hypothetical protein